MVADPPAPLVLMGEGRLDCRIDTRVNGTQKLTLAKGAGLSFNAVVSPIVDGTVHLKGPDKGGEYRFTSHLAHPGQGQLTGVGAVEITELETKVTVSIARYQQPKGPGTPLRFEARDMLDGNAYIEFTGVARGPGHERYKFSMNLSNAKDGSGEVSPADTNLNSRIVSKAVVAYAPVVLTVVKTQVQKLP
jgi:hypothetical protein